MDKSFVVDNSVIMSWCFRDEKSPYADRILDRLAAACYNKSARSSWNSVAAKMRW